MSEVEREVIALLERGYARWYIAEELGLGETTVREVIRRLCERYQCSQRDLPEQAKGDL